jgi:hypothetical protein
MDFLKDRRIVLVLTGAAVALLAGLAIAWTLVAQHRGETTGPPPASRAGLVIDSAGAADAHADSTQPLRCFVAGQFVGEMTLAACAKRNGVSTDALDVGLDPSGALAAADQAGAMITPLPPADSKVEEATPVEAAPVTALPQVVSGPSAVCLSYAAGQWRRLPNEMALSACAQALFAGRCEHAGEAAYGRWGQQTLRLVASGRVETSADNRNFRPLMDQPGCPAAPAG